MKKIVRASLATIRKALVAKLKEAHKKAKLKKGVSVEFAAEILMNTLHGVRVNARDGKNARQLRDLIKFSVVSLKK